MSALPIKSFKVMFPPSLKSDNICDALNTGLDKRGFRERN